MKMRGSSRQTLHESYQSEMERMNDAVNHNAELCFQLENIIKEKDTEIERLREALQEILKTNHMDYVLMKEIASAALKEKE